MSILPIGTQNYSNEELALMSSAQYRSINSGPWEESYMDNLELSRTSGLGTLSSEFTDFDTDRTMDVSTGRINNGRMSDLSNRLTDSALETEVIIFNTNSTDATKGIIEETNVTRILFSRQNMDALQASIRYKINNMIKDRISNQDENELYVIMRSVMLQYANFRADVNDIVNEIKRLNQKVLIYCIQNISSNVQQHMGYVEDLSKLPTPMDMPVYHNKKNFRAN